MKHITFLLVCYERSPSQPQPVEPQPQCFFLNYQLAKENLSPKTNKIYVLIVFINSTKL